MTSIAGRLVFISPLNGVQKTVHQLEVVLELISIAGMSCNSVLVLHDTSTKQNGKNIVKKIKSTHPSLKQISYQELPLLNDIMDENPSIEFKPNDLILAAGSGVHRALVFHNLIHESSLTNDTVFLLHPHPSGRSLTIHRLTLTPEGVDVQLTTTPHPEKIQSLEQMLFESGAQIGEKYTPQSSISEETMTVIENESEMSLDEFRSYMSKRYNLLTEQIGFKMETVAGELMGNLHEEFTEIYGNIEFRDSDSNVTYQEEDLVAMLVTGDIVWISAKFSHNSKVIQKDRERLKGSLPIPFPQQRIHRYVLTFSSMAKMPQAKSSRVKVICLNEFPSNIRDLIGRTS